MKKFLMFAVIAAAGYALWRKYSEDSAERDLWAEVTDTFA